MKFLPTPLPGSYLVDLTPFADESGWFARTFAKMNFGKLDSSKNGYRSTTPSVKTQAL